MPARSNLIARIQPYIPNFDNLLKTIGSHYVKTSLTECERLDICQDGKTNYFSEESFASDNTRADSNEIDEGDDENTERSFSALEDTRYEVSDEEDVYVLQESPSRHQPQTPARSQAQMDNNGSASIFNSGGAQNTQSNNYESPDRERRIYFGTEPHAQRHNINFSSIDEGREDTYSVCGTLFDDEDEFEEIVDLDSSPSNRSRS